MRITVSQIMAWGPGDDYPRARVVKLFGGQGSLSAKDVLGLSIPHADRLWGVLRPGILSDSQVRLLAVNWALRALNRERAAGREPDHRSWVACRVAERFARGHASREELNTAEANAWLGTWSVGRSAERSAAWGAEEAMQRADILYALGSGGAS